MRAIVRGAVVAALAGSTAAAQPTSPAPQPPPVPTTPAPAALPRVDVLTDEELARIAAQEAEQAATSGEVITVTGSLIGRKALTSTSPIVVLDRERLAAAGITSAGAILQRLPAQGNALNAQNNNGGDGSVRLNLRSLGPNRTLVLLDGRRVVASGLGADDAVDLGTIPLAMIERVEVLEDGASSLYGSDAIGGVVNIITRSDFEGAEATAYTGTSQHGDGTNYDLSFLVGQSGKRGNVTFSAGYQRQYPVWAGARAFSARSRIYDFDNHAAVLDGSTATPNGIIDATDIPQGSIPGCTGPLCTYDPGAGVWRDYVDPTGTSFGDSYNAQPENYAYTPSQRLDLFANGHYDLTRHARAFFQASFDHRASALQLAPERLFTGESGVVISAASMYNPFGVDIADYSRRLVELGPRRFEQGVDTARTVVGLDGQLDEAAGPFEDWKWELSLGYGRSAATNRVTGPLVLSRLRAALGPSFFAADGTPTCGTPTAPIAGCVPLDLLTPGRVTRAMRDYLAFTGVNTGENTQRTVLATAHGKLLSLPNGGDLSLAVGVDHRHEHGTFTPDPLTATGDTTSNVYEPTSGGESAFEAFTEASLVPLAGKRLARWVEVDASARAYRYDTFGSGVTGKLGALWSTAYGIAVRGTLGTAFRAPSVQELYLGSSDSFELFEDPCDTRPPSAGGATVTLDPDIAAQCASQGVPANATFGTSQQRAVYGGSKNLQPESARVATAGVVYEPVSGLGITVDYWRVAIDHTIALVPPSVILSNCYHHGVGCERIERSETTHEIVRILDLSDNIGTTTTSGIDGAVAYTHKLAGGQARHALDASYLLAYDVDNGLIGDDGKPQVLRGRGVYDLGVLPAVKLALTSSWRHPSGLGGGINARFVGGFDECANDACNDPSNARRRVAPWAAADVFVDWAIDSAGGHTRVTLGMNNVTNASPPVIYNGAVQNADESAYDFIGRYLYLRATQRF